MPRRSCLTSSPARRAAAATIAAALAAPALVGLTVTPANAFVSGPVDDAGETFADRSVVLDVLANDPNDMGHPRTVEVVQVAEHGLVVSESSETAFRYTPDPGFVGTDTFQYRTYDLFADEYSATAATVTITVNALQPPTVVADEFLVTEDTADNLLGVLANDSDPDGGTLSLVLDGFTQPAHGAVVRDGDGFRYTPDADYFGSDSFTYKALDDEGSASEPATVTVNVTGVQDAPVFTGSPANTTQAVAVGATLASLDAVDADREELTYSVLSGDLPEGVTLLPDGSFDGVVGRAGPSVALLRVSDGTQSDDSELTVTATVTNTAPNAVPDQAEVDSGSSVEVDVLGNDTDEQGDALALDGFTQLLDGNDRVVGSVAAGESPGHLAVTAFGSFSGPATVGYTVSDGVDPADGLVQVDVNAVGVDDVLEVDASLEPGATRLGRVGDNDLGSFSNGNGFPFDRRFGIVAPAEHGTADISVVQDPFDKPVPVYTPAPGFSGVDTFAYEAFDVNERKISAEVTVRVRPSLGDDYLPLDHGSSAVVDVLANDVGTLDAASLRISSLADPDDVEALGASVVDGRITLDPRPEAIDTYYLDYTVEDEAGQSEDATLVVEIRNVAVEDRASVFRNGRVDIDVLANDKGLLDAATLSLLAPDRDGELELSGGFGPARTAGAVATSAATGNGTAEIVNGRIRYTPNRSFVGTDVFEYTVVPLNNGAAVTGLVTVTVRNAPVVPAPVEPTVEPTAVTVPPTVAPAEPTVPPVATTVPPVVPTAAPAATPPAPTGKPPVPTLDVPAPSRELSPGERATVRGTAPAGTTVRLFARTAPATTYLEVRRAVVGADGTFGWSVSPNRNTKLYVEVAGVKSPVVDVAVAQTVTVRVDRRGPRTERFRGGAYPAQAGQLLSIYRTGVGSKPVLVGQTRTKPDGTYSYDRRFGGTGTFAFYVQAVPSDLNDEGLSPRVRRTIS